MPVMIGLVDPKSPTNVGAVLRAAGCYQADAVRYTGSRYDRAARYQTDTHSAAERIPLERVAAITSELSATIKLVCVELVEGATPLPLFQHPDNALYVFGPEDGTLEQSLIDQADAVVYVPTEGCMNLAASVNVVLYDRLAKSPNGAGNTEQLLQSRDTNNRIRVRKTKKD